MKRVPHIFVIFNNFFLFIQLNIVEGMMQHLFDENGRRYLDAFAGIVTISCGHCHPEVLNAIMEQSKLLQHTTTIYLHHAIADFAEALASKVPGNLKVKFIFIMCVSVTISEQGKDPLALIFHMIQSHKKFVIFYICFS